jgi:hypothetical protein
MIPEPPPKVDSKAAMAAFNRHQVEYVVIGGISAIAHGSAMLTKDTDFCYRRTKANIARMVEALSALHAQPRNFEAALPFSLDVATIWNGDTFTFMTDAGNLDCLGVPAATAGYSDLLKNATLMDFGDGVTAHVCSIDDLIRMKTAAGRPKDLYAVENLKALKQVISEERYRE